MSSEPTRVALFANKGFVSLDLLRGAAAFAVIVPHYFMFQGHTTAALEFVSIMAVEVFFVLSGFVLARQLVLCVESQSLRNLGVFYGRRWMRTLPPYVIILVLISIMSGQLFTADFWQYLIFIRNFFDASSEGDYYPPAWSLAVEEWFYVLFPVFLIVLSRLGAPKIWAAIIFAVILLVFKAAYATQLPDLFADGRRIAILRLDAIGLGFALALFDIRGLARHRRLLPALAAFALTALGVSAFAYTHSLVLLYCYAAPLFSASLLYLILRLEPKIASFRGLRTIAAVGANTSYTAYLAHMLIILLLGGLRDAMPNGAHFVLYILVLLGFCILFFLTIEAPILRRRPSYAPLVLGAGHHAASGQSHLPAGRVRARPGLIVLTNVAVAIGLCALAESAAWGIRQTYVALRQADFLNMAQMEAAVAATDTNDNNSLYSSPAVPRDLARNKDMPGGAFRYENYLIFQNRPFKSEHVNVASDGRRLNNDKPPKDATVWVFGSSPIFGTTNADGETLPAYLEERLSAALEGDIRVANFGVAGYTSWQDLIHFQYRLSHLPKPRLVLFFNGHNDYNLAWLSGPGCERLYETAVGSSRVLSESWELRAHGGFVIWPAVRDAALGYFPNILEIRRLVHKAFHLRWANANIEEWRQGYLKQRRETLATAAKCQSTEQQMYLRNMRLAAALAKSEGIAIGFIHQPIIHATNKILTSYEDSYVRNSIDNSFSLSEEELAELRSVPSHRLDQAYVWDKSSYTNGYYTQKARLRDLAAETGAVFIDADAVVDQSATTIFSSSIHFTFRGTGLIAGEIARRILEPQTEAIFQAKP